MSINEMLMAAAGTGGGDQTFVEDVFSTYLYTGNGSTQTITNGIDLAGEGGLVWIKSRSNANDHNLYDTARGNTSMLGTNFTNAAATTADFNSFNNNGFTLNTPTTTNNLNRLDYTQVSWTFRKAPKFFDVVTYTGNGVAGRQIAHNLGSAPGMVIVKRTDSAGTDWMVRHRSIPVYSGALNLTTPIDANDGFGNQINDLTSTYFSVGGNAPTNANGATYVAYLFAHDAGGFGEAGTDNVISCGSFTTNGSGNATVSLGYEPQYMLLKSSSVDDGYGWLLFDTMRGWNEIKDFCLKANSSNAEFDAFALGSPKATGFDTRSLQADSTYIYMAIRRPMKVPTTGTEVFKPDYNASFPQPGTVTTNFVADWDIYKRTNGSSTVGGTRLTGGKYLFLNDTSAEGGASSFLWDRNTSLVVQNLAGSGEPTVNYTFRRAPNFFDVVCYTGTGAAGQAVNHNLTVPPELILLKKRNAVWDWRVYSAPTGNGQVMYLNDTAAAGSADGWNNQTPTSTQFFLNGYNASGDTFVAYLFATLAGVSKVGSYTGNGSSQTINCGFSGGARFVLIKRTDSTGDWYVWDTARGIVSGNDPRLSLNTTAAEVTSDDSVDPDSSGFVVNQLSATNINVSSASYIFLAVA